MREFIDKEHPIIKDYYNIMERYTGKNAPYIIPKLQKLIESEPFFFDTYTSLVDLFYTLNQHEKGDIFINQASEKALKRIIDKKGDWPDKLEWGWLENRHVIRAILNQAILYWKNEKINEALDLFRKLLRSNPPDNIGARNYILAIRKNLSFLDFELKFNKGGFYGMDLVNWFENNYKSYPDEFGWWDEEMNKLENEDEEFELDGMKAEEEMLFFTLENIFEEFETSKDVSLILDSRTKKKSKNEKSIVPQVNQRSESRIFQLKISIKDIKPPIWRRILISNQTSFQDLHVAIQDYFNWGNYHLHEFNFSHKSNPSKKISILGLYPDGNTPDDLNAGFLDQYEFREDEVKLCDIFSANCRTVRYFYDFGDNWEHSIKLEKIFPFKKGFKGPLCTGGKRAAPPEDCGGSWGYQDLIDILNNMHHPEYQEMREWVGANFNPEKMDVQLIKLSPKQIEQKYGPCISE